MNFYNEKPRRDWQGNKKYRQYFSKNMGSSGNEPLTLKGISHD